MRFRRLSHRHGEGGETHEKSPGPGYRLPGVRPSGMRRAAADLCFSQKQGKGQLSLLRLPLLYAAPPLWRHTGGGGGVCLSGLAYRGRLGTDCRILSAGLCAGGRPPDGAGPVPGQGGVRAIQPLVRIKRPFDYRADDVWHAARNVLRRSKEDYEVLSADRQRLELSIKRKTRSDRMACCFWLSVEPAESGGCRMVVYPARGYDEEDLRDAGDELEQVCLLTEEELERFSRPRIGPGGHT